MDNRNEYIMFLMFLVSSFTYIVMFIILSGLIQ
jgi:hypothetical protein